MGEGLYGVWAWTVNVYLACVALLATQCCCQRFVGPVFAAKLQLKFQWARCFFPGCAPSYCCGYHGSLQDCMCNTVQCQVPGLARNEVLQVSTMLWDEVATAFTLQCAKVWDFCVLRILLMFAGKCRVGQLEA